MASNKTEQFGLNQWDKTDPVRVEDFNEDNRKIDAAIAAARTSPCCVTGIYQGNGGETLEVNVGFRPSFLMIIATREGSSSSYNYVFTLGISKKMIYGSTSGTIGHYPYCTFTDTGFTITYDTMGYGMNATNVTATYIAFY